MPPSIPDMLSRARPATTEISPREGLFLALVVFTMAQTLMVRLGSPNLLDGELWDSDSYMWMERARQLTSGAGWFDHRNARIDPPAGFILHWTRPMDALLLAGAWMLTPMLGFEAALFWWGAATGPVLFIASAAAYVWAARPLLPHTAHWLPPLILACQPAFLVGFLVGRPDHQSLLILLFILFLGCALRLALAPGSTGRAAFAGVVAALGLWVSIQFLPIVAVLLAVLLAAWISGERPVAAMLAIFCATVSLGMAAALLVEYGGAAFDARPLDTLSPGHLWLFGLATLFWIAAAASPLTRKRERLLFLALAGGIGGGLLWLAAPDLFTRPIGPTDPLQLAIYLEHIRELQPAVRLNSDIGWSELVAVAILRLGIAVPAILFLLHRFWHSEERERRAWGLLAVATAIYVPMALLQLRWSIYALAVLILPYAALAATALRALTRVKWPRFTGLVVRPLVAALICVWIYVPALGFGLSAIPGAATRTESSCRTTPVMRFLGAPEGLGARPLTVLAFVDLGAKILYFTPHSVLSIANHRPQPGFTRTLRIMSETDAATAVGALRAGGIDLVLTCSQSLEAVLYRPDGNGISLYQRLVSRTPPTGLTRIRITGTGDSGYYLYRVEPSGP